MLQVEKFPALTYTIGGDEHGILKPDGGLKVCGHAMEINIHVLDVIMKIWTCQNMKSWIVMAAKRTVFRTELIIFSFLSLFLFSLYIRGDVLPATCSPPHLIVFSTLLCLLSSSPSLPPLPPSSHLSLGLPRLLLPSSRNSAALFGSLSSSHSGSKWQTKP